MHVFRDLQHAEPPPCTLLAIRGERFELGEAPTDAALEHLAVAVAWGRDWLATVPERARRGRGACMRSASPATSSA
jgi:hypothetical protein